jgi:heavy metal translocating P-type ATPase
LKEGLKMLLTISAISMLATVGAVYVRTKTYRKNRNATHSIYKSDKKRLSSVMSLSIHSQQSGGAFSTADEKRVSEVKKEINWDLAFSLSSLGLTTAGKYYPPLNLLSLPGLVYVYIPWFKDGYDSIFKERQIRMATVDMFVLSGILVARLYFPAALIATFLSLSKKLLFKAEDHAQKRLFNVFSGMPRSVWLLTEQKIEIEIPFEDLKIGDLIVVHAGETVPVDGTISAGYAQLDQRILTGESQPAEKGPGDQVFALTIVLSGRIHIKVEKAGQDTVAAQIGDILNSTADFRHSMQWQWMAFVDKTALPTLGAGVLTLPIVGPTGALAMMFSVSFGYAMRVIAPITLLSSLNLASKNGILIKDGRALELLNQVDTIVFDKTGTLTQEQPTVSEIYTLNGYSEDELLTYAATAEYKQKHPIAKAILERAELRRLSLPEIEEAQYEIGYGLKVTIGQKLIQVGSTRFMALSGIAIPAEIREIQEQSHEEGHSLICVAINEQVSGAIELKPTIRPEAKRIIKGLRERGMSMYIISGDHQKPTQKLAEELGIEHYFAEILPENKATLIEQLQQEGKCVCFVGDGINDSIALKKANLSISLRGASSIATDTAQIILMDESLNELVQLFDIGKQFKINIKNGFLITVLPNMAAAGGILFLHFGIVTSIVLFYTSMALGAGNSMLPLLKNNHK